MGMKKIHWALLILMYAAILALHLSIPEPLPLSEDPVYQEALRKARADIENDTVLQRQRQEARAAYVEEVISILIRMSRDTVYRDSVRWAAEEERNQ